MLKFYLLSSLYWIVLIKLYWSILFTEIHWSNSIPWILFIKFYTLHSIYSILAIKFYWANSIHWIHPFILFLNSIYWILLLCSVDQILFVKFYLLNCICWILFIELYLLNSIVNCLYLFNSNDLVNHDVNSTGVLRSDVSVYVTGFVLC